MLASILVISYWCQVGIAVLVLGLAIAILLPRKKEVENEQVIDNELQPLEPVPPPPPPETYELNEDGTHDAFRD